MPWCRSAVESGTLRHVLARADEVIELRMTMSAYDPKRTCTPADAICPKGPNYYVTDK